jgi:hypothetical protein
MSGTVRPILNAEIAAQKKQRKQENSPRLCETSLSSAFQFFRIFRCETMFSHCEECPTLSVDQNFQ